jgi:hypothetical protein
MDITRRSDISYAEFIERYYKTGVPLVFSGEKETWKEGNVFSPDWFKKIYTDKAVVRLDTTYHMKEIMTMVEAATEANDSLYPFKFDIADQMPELTQWIRTLNPAYALQNWSDNKILNADRWVGATELTVDGVVTNTSHLKLEYHPSDTWTAQLYGEKQFIVFWGGQTSLLYPNSENPYRSDLNVFEPDLKKYPKYDTAKSINFVLRPGETAFIPAGCWYATRPLTTTISVAFSSSNKKMQKRSIKNVPVAKNRENKLKTVISHVFEWIVAQGNKIGARFKQKAF